MIGVKGLQELLLPSCLPINPKTLAKVINKDPRYVATAILGSP